MKNLGTARPVPIAPPPRLMGFNRSVHFDTLHQSRDKASLYELKSRLNEEGTASCICVKPGRSLSSDSLSSFSIFNLRLFILPSRDCSKNIAATVSAVGITSFVDW